MTNSLRAATGRQEPSFRADPPTVASTIDGEDAAFLSAAYGLTLDPFQEHILDAWLARRTDDRLAAPRAGVAIPRQNGKNGALEAYELFTTVVLGRKILHTAHEVKALDIETPILAERGWTTMGDLETGDRVYGPDGHLTNVVAHPFRYERPCFRLTFDDGQTVVADEDHLWGVTFVSTWGRKKYTVVNTREMFEHGVSTVTTRCAGRDRKTYHWRVQLTDPLDLPEADLPIDPWLLGAWIGDGTTTRGEITEGQEDAPTVRRRAEDLGYRVSERVDKRTGAVTLGITGLRSQLRALSILGAKTIPEAYMLGSVHQRQELLAGLMDTDGTTMNGQCEIGTIDRALSEQYLQLARSLGYKATWRETRAKLNGKDCGPFFVIQFRASQQDSPFQLGRKASRLPEQRYAGTRSSYNAIVSIEPVETRTTRCITVDNESRLYVVGKGFVPTHNTGRKAFVRLARFFESNDELSARVESIRKVNGQEHIMLTNGGSVEFIARSKSSGRGFTADTLVLDEAQELNDEAMEALLPTISSSPSGDSQTIMLGTPPAPGNDGEMFTRWHDAAHESADPGLSWMEWSADTPSGGPVDLDDPENWERSNPALGGRMSIDVVIGERATFADQSFARERLGMWATEESERVLPLAQWEACSNPNLVDDGGEVALAIDVNPARDCSSIAAAGSAVDGTPFVDVIETRRGTPEWLLERVASICSRQPVRAVLIDGKGPAASLIDPLKRRKVKVSVTGAGNMAAAVAEFYDAVMAERLIHLDQPGLNLAAAVARKRRLGDAWAWNRKDTESDITPLVAATLALFGHTYTGVKRPRPRNTNRKVVVW